MWLYFGAGRLRAVLGHLRRLSHVFNTKACRQRVQKWPQGWKSEPKGTQAGYKFTNIQDPVQWRQLLQWQMACTFGWPTAVTLTAPQKQVPVITAFSACQASTSSCVLPAANAASTVSKGGLVVLAPAPMLTNWSFWYVCGVMFSAECFWDVCGASPRTSWQKVVNFACPTVEVDVGLVLNY